MASGPARGGEGKGINSDPPALLRSPDPCGRGRRPGVVLLVVSATSKSPRRVLMTAHHVAARAFPRHWNKYSRRDYTVPRLFACLVLKEFERKDYRGVEQLLLDCPDLRQSIGPAGAPDHTTLKRAADRLLKLPKARRVLDEAVAFARACKVLGPFVAPAAMDASGYSRVLAGTRGYSRVLAGTHGFESRHVGAYFVRRGAEGGAARGGPSRGPRRTPGSPSSGSPWSADAPGPVVRRRGRAGVRSPALRRLPVPRPAAGVGEEGGRRRRVRLRGRPPPGPARPGGADGHPAADRPADGQAPAGRWRRVMRRLTGTKAARKRSGYTQRWQAETVNSMMKRNQGSALRARTHHTRNRELALRVLTHDLAVLRRRVATEQVFVVFRSRFAGRCATDKGSTWFVRGRRC